MRGFTPVAYEIVEHTADVGIKASGRTLAEAFRETTLGLLEITGTWVPDGGDAFPLEFEGTDAGSLLVDWLGEILYLQDAHDSLVSAVEVQHADPTRVVGSVRLTPRGDIDPEGTAVKAITYHQLAVAEQVDGWKVTVFVDV
jgi:SHS2 domain-containing protein